MLEQIAIKAMIEPVIMMLARSGMDMIKDQLRSDDDPSKITYAIKRSSDSEETKQLMEDINKCLRIEL